MALYGPPAGGQEERVAAAEQSYEYFGRLLARRRRDPGDDLLTALIARLEATCAYARLAQRVRAPRLAVDPPPYRDHFTLRRVAALPVDHAGFAPRTVAW